MSRRPTLSRVAPAVQPARRRVKIKDLAALLPAVAQDQQDPARMVAASMISRSLAPLAAATWNDAMRGLATVIEVPDACWIQPVIQAWSGWKDGRTPTGWVWRGGGTNVGGWTYFTADSQASPAELLEAAERFADAISSGHPCVGVAPDLSWLPRELIDHADVRLRLQPPSGKDLASMVRELCGPGPATTPSNIYAQWVTPRALKLARRHGQSAGDYLSRLTTIIGCDRVRPIGGEPASPRSTPQLSGLHGMQEAVDWGNAVAAGIAAYRAGRLPWDRVDSGAVLSGPPGCGKSLFVRALAATSGASLVTGSYAKWIGTGRGHQGDLLRGMARTFAEARRDAPTILHLDELDSFTNRDAGSDDHRGWIVPVVNGLLSELDGLGDRKAVVVVGTCNRADILDPALRRSGRLERHLEIGLPSSGELQRILREHLADDLAGCDLSQAAIAAAGCTGADCERHVRGARRRAREAGRTICLADLVAETTGNWNPSGQDAGVAAAHEAGHVVASALLRPGSVVAASLASVFRRGGTTRGRPGLPRLLNIEDIRNSLVILLAGRAAEGLLRGSVSSASGGPQDSDLALATELATAADASFGLAEGGHLLWRRVDGACAASDLLCGDPLLAERVTNALERAHKAARRVLGQKLPAVRAVAKVLLERGFIAGVEVEAIVRSDRTCAASGTVPHTSRRMDA